MPEDQLLRILEGPLERFTENTTVDPTSLKGYTRRILDEAYMATWSRNWRRDCSAVGAPIWRRRRRGSWRGERVGPGLPSALRCSPRLRELSPDGLPPSPLPGIPGLEPWAAELSTTAKGTTSGYEDFEQLVGISRA